jgi:hypothetical protein
VQKKDGGLAQIMRGDSFSIKIPVQYQGKAQSSFPASLRIVFWPQNDSNLLITEPMKAFI